MYMDKEYYFFRNSEFHETEQHETLSSEKSSTLYRFTIWKANTIYPS